MAFSFELTAEQERLKELAREFGEREIAPIAAEMDEKDEFSWDMFRKVTQPPYRFNSIIIPKEHGGLGLGWLELAIVSEELIYAGTSPMGYLTIASAGINIFTALANEQQRKKYLSAILSGEGRISFALTEPRGGSDPTGMETVAERVDNDYVLNGTKSWASFTDRAHVAVVFAKQPALGPKAISAFLVPTDNPGLEITDKVSCMGLRGHRDVHFNLVNCRIPGENLLGEEGKGLRNALATLENGRLSVAAGYLGLARVALESAVKRAKERVLFDHPLFDNQAISFPLAEIVAQIESTRLLIYKACWLSDKGIPHRAEAAMVKMLAGDVLLKAVDMELRVWAGAGVTKRFPVERHFRDAKVWVFGQGAPEIQRLIIARAL
ncbi:acyl-CoA dehydrogenase family protein [Chloroflexota bacterium]